LSPKQKEKINPNAKKYFHHRGHREHREEVKEQISKFRIIKKSLLLEFVVIILYFSGPSVVKP
jgi:hypothetical protein